MKRKHKDKFVEALWITIPVALILAAIKFGLRKTGEKGNEFANQI